MERYLSLPLLTVSAWTSTDLDSTEELTGRPVQEARSLYGADLVFSDNAIREIAQIALERGKGARRLRSVVKEVFEGDLFEVEAVVHPYLANDAVSSCVAEHRLS